MSHNHRHTQVGLPSTANYMQYSVCRLLQKNNILLGVELSVSFLDSYNMCPCNSYFWLSYSVCAYEQIERCCPNRMTTISQLPKLTNPVPRAWAETWCRLWGRR